MGNDFGDCLKKGRIVPFKATSEIIKAQLNEASSHLSRARDGLKQGLFGWTVQQGFHAMCHSLRALIYSQGYRATTHPALGIALEELFIKTKQIESKFLEYFRNAKKIEEEGLSSKDSSQVSQEVLQNAQEVYELASKLTAT
jgi:uncharacterized protein (UPF0332 family)